MIEFKIEGRSLDLPEKTTVQLLRKNEIFAFDAIEVERSVSFEIPATPENNDILQLSNDYHCAGAFMRVKIAAQMIIGIVTRDGYLCLTQYDHKKKAYKAIFLFGQLLGLQRLRDAQKFNEMGLQTDLYIDGNSTIYNAPSATGETWAKVKYYRDTNPNGSVSVKLLTEMMNAQRPDLPAITLPAGTDGLRIIRAEMSGFDYAQKLKSTLNPDGGSQPDTSYPPEPYNLQEYDPTLFDVVTDIFAQGGSSNVYYRIQGLKVLTPLSISFPNGMSEKWFLQKGGYTGGISSNFYGGHWWEQGAQNADPIIHGESLSGKTVDFAAGDEFYLVNVDDFRYTSAGGLTINGWMFVQQGRTFPYDFEIKVQGEDRFFLRDNMPDFTPVELCKIVAALTGTVLRYTETQGVWFDDLQSGWETKSLEDVIERTTMERKFGDYAQRNYVRFEDEDNPQPLETVYTIDNANLEEEKELQTMPLASGVTRVRNYYPAIDLATDKDTIAETIADSNYLQRVSLRKNAEIQGFCDASTTLKLSALQNILEYVQVNPKTLFFFDGALWAWNDMQWNDGKLQAQLAQRGSTTPPPPPAVSWITDAAQAEIVAQFGQQQGSAAIDAANAYLDEMAETESREAAQECADYINARPMSVVLYARMYVQDGLIMQADCAYKCTDTEWRDFVEGLAFGCTDVQIANGVPQFNGTSSKCLSQDTTGVLPSEGTIEVVFKQSDTNIRCIFADGRDNYQARYWVGYRSNQDNMLVTSGRGSGNTYDYYAMPFTRNTQFNTVGIVANSMIVVNGTRSNPTTNKTGWAGNSASNPKVIGCTGRNTFYFKGEIYAVRLYNRILTEAEIRANQELDLIRWQ